MNKQKIKNNVNKILDLLIPPDIKCIFCGEEIKTQNKYQICDECAKNLPYNNQKVCKLCGCKIHDQADVCLSCFYSPPPFFIARAPFLYEPPISGIISNLKFENAKFAVKPLSEFLIDEYIKNNYDCDLIIPVPLSPEREKQRKYNQAQLLSQGLAKHFNLPILNDVVVRSKHTFPQAKLNWRARQQNMIDAFKLQSNKKLKGKKILVVDDVMTTGATIKNLCKELQKAKPAKIFVLTLAHTYINRTKIKNKNIFEKYKKKLKIKLLNNKIIKKFNKFIKK